MEVHHPKTAVHSLRELGKEVGIIVIGVLIALGAEQAVEAMHWAHQMDVQRTALRRELVINANWFAERVAIADCLTARRGLLEAALAQPGNDWKAEAVLPGAAKRSVYPVAWRNFPGQSWQNAVANGAASRMSPEEMLAYAAVYGDISDMHQMNIQEQLAALQLSDLEQDTALSETSRDRFHKALDELKFYSGGATGIAQESLQQLKAMHISPSASDLHDILADDHALYGSCVRTTAAG
ncbi:MAG TPA: hypothetical protein VGL66_12045 [Caulobacteraceae bacterium]|jgi:hypothetical protein